MTDTQDRQKHVSHDCNAQRYMLKQLHGTILFVKRTILHLYIFLSFLVISGLLLSRLDSGLQRL